MEFRIEVVLVCYQNFEVSLLIIKLSIQDVYISFILIEIKIGSNFSQKDFLVYYEIFGINRINQIKKIDYLFRNVYFRYQVRIREVSISGIYVLIMFFIGILINKCEQVVQ